MDKNIKEPTVGRILHYFPVNDSQSKVNGKDEFHPVPAIVTAAMPGGIVNLRVFTDSPDPPLQRLSVEHWSDVAEWQNREGQSPVRVPKRAYWMWPV